MTKSKLQFIKNFIFWFLLNLFLGGKLFAIFYKKKIYWMFYWFFLNCLPFFIIKRSIWSRNGIHMTWFTNRFKGGCSNVTSKWQDRNKQGNKFLSPLKKSIPTPSNLCPNYFRDYYGKLPNIITVTWLALFNTLYSQIIISYLRMAKS